MKELGHLLKTERIQNGVSLTEASEDLSLSTTMLENIESGNVRAFKDVDELREHVKKYAKYLGVDVNNLAGNIKSKNNTLEYSLSFNLNQGVFCVLTALAKSINTGSFVGFVGAETALDCIG